MHHNIWLMIIDADGKPVDGRGEISNLTIPPAESSGQDRSNVLETGIKLVDLFAPIKRGGSVGREFCLVVGQMLLTGQIIHNLVTRDNVRVVYIHVPEGPGRRAPGVLDFYCQFVSKWCGIRCRRPK